MPQKISPRQESHVRGSLALGMPHKQIAKDVGISVRQVERIKHNLVFYGSASRPKKSQQGRQPTITEGMAQVCPNSMIQTHHYQKGASRLFD